MGQCPPPRIFRLDLPLASRPQNVAFPLTLLVILTTTLTLPCERVISVKFYTQDKLYMGVVKVTYPKFELYRAIIISATLNDITFEFYTGWRGGRGKSHMTKFLVVHSLIKEHSNLALSRY